VVPSFSAVFTFAANSNTVGYRWATHLVARLSKSGRRTQQLDGGAVDTDLDARTVAQGCVMSQGLVRARNNAGTELLFGAALEQFGTARIARRLSPIRGASTEAQLRASSPTWRRISSIAARRLRVMWPPVMSEMCISAESSAGRQMLGTDERREKTSGDSTNGRAGRSQGALKKPLNRRLERTDKAFGDMQQRHLDHVQDALWCCRSAIAMTQEVRG
jgi:hypothetical protein